MAEKLPNQLEAFFDPSSVAIVGASGDIEKWGFGILSQFVTKDPDVEVYPINPNKDEILGMKTYKSMKEVPDGIDLVIIVVSKEAILDIVESCKDKDVKNILIITAGFAEVGEEEREFQEKIVKIAHEGKTRIAGPNSMGHVNVHADLYTTRLMPRLKRGGVSIISQSGTFGVHIIQNGSEEGLGFSKYISTGNEADYNFEDYVEYMGRDPNTDVIVGYIEGLRNGRKFLDVAKEVSKEKPIFVLKVGRTEEGSKATDSHTGAMAGETSVYRGAFRQSGVLQARDLPELLGAIKIYNLQPLPKGRRVGILTGGGGFGCLTTDEAVEHGLEVPNLSEETMDRLNDILPPRWSRENPVDMAAAYGIKTYECLSALLNDENFDIIIAAHSLGMSSIMNLRDLVPSDYREEAEKRSRKYKEIERENFEDILSSIEESNKTVVGIGSPGITTEEDDLAKEIKKEIPMFVSPSVAIGALSLLVEYHEYLSENYPDSLKI